MNRFPLRQTVRTREPRTERRLVATWRFLPSRNVDPVPGAGAHFARLRILSTRIGWYLNAQHRIVGVSTLALLGLGIMLSGCARVRPYEREFLSDPIMSIEASMDAEARELKWLEAREGSTGGTGGAGGGCACN